jgi:hypothetical protein
MPTLHRTPKYGHELGEFGVGLAVSVLNRLRDDALALQPSHRVALGEPLSADQRAWHLTAVVEAAAIV